MKSPKAGVVITPMDSAGNMLKQGTRRWPYRETTYEQRIAECIKRAGPKKVARLVVYCDDGTIFMRLNAKGIEEVVEAAEAQPAPKKVKVARKPKERRVVKAPGAVGHTKANELKLPNHAGVASAMQTILAEANPLSDKGWTANETLDELEKRFPGRPRSGMLITLRAQISRKFNANVVVRKQRDGREQRYAI